MIQIQQQLQYNANTLVFQKETSETQNDDVIEYQMFIPRNLIDMSVSNSHNELPLLRRSLVFKKSSCSDTNQAYRDSTSQSQLVQQSIKDADQIILVNLKQQLINLKKYYMQLVQNMDKVIKIQDINDQNILKLYQNQTKIKKQRDRKLK